LELPLLLNQLPCQRLASLKLVCPPPYFGDRSPEMEAAMAAAARLALRRFAHLTSLHLAAKNVLPEDASALAALTALSVLHLSSAANIPLDVAAAAVSLPGLTRLQLEAATGPPPSRGVLSRLASLPRLQDLKLHWTQDCGGCLEVPLAPALPALRGLDLWCDGGVQVGGVVAHKTAAAALHGLQGFSAPGQGCGGQGAALPMLSALPLHPCGCSWVMHARLHVIFTHLVALWS
jgi:hypothetical protein